MFDIATLKNKRLFELQEIARSLMLKNTTQFRKNELLEKIIATLDDKGGTKVPPTTSSTTVKDSLRLKDLQEDPPPQPPSPPQVKMFSKKQNGETMKRPLKSLTNHS
ncbi:MAG: Rho termination factor N-terminal domain-containing protein [Flavobacteriales bacterium]